MNMKNKLNLKDEIIDVLKSNPLLLLFNLPIVIGGLVVIIYLLHIDFFPIVSTSDIILLLLFSSVLGLVILLFFSIIMVFPVFQYQSCEGIVKFEQKVKNKCLRTNIDIKHETQSKNKFIQFIYKVFILFFSNKCYKKDKKAICNPQIKLLFIPLAINVLLINALFYLDYYLNMTVFRWSIIPLSIVIVVLVSLYFFYKQSKLLNSNISISVILKKKLFITYLKSIFLSTIFIFIAFFVLMLLLENNEGLKNNELILFIYTFSFIMMAAAIGIMEGTIWKKLFIVMITFLVLSFMLHIQHVVPSSIMRLFSIGQVKMERLVLTKEGCQIIDFKTSDEFCEKKDLNLLWRIGEVYLFNEVIEKNIVDDKEILKVRRYYIPKKHIISMIQLSEVEKQVSNNISKQ